jgi:putative membrane protein
MTAEVIPALNAVLNGIATICLTAGFFFIRRGNILSHRRCMKTAASVSALFLVGYITQRVLRGETRFGGSGAIRTAYLVMLASHVILATSIVFLVPRTLILALQGQFDRHRAWARWTFPIWYYVSVTGVLIYFCLFQWWPHGA